MAIYYYIGIHYTHNIFITRSQRTIIFLVSYEIGTINIIFYRT